MDTKRGEGERGRAQQGSELGARASAPHPPVALGSSADAVVGTSLDGTIVSWNDAAERLYGYSQDEALGRPITLVVPRSRQAEVAEALERLARGELIDHQETVRVRKGGARVAVAVAVVPVRDASGAVVGAAGIARDISERKRAEAMRAHLASIVESSDDAIITTDIDGRVTSWNRGAERLYGYAAGEVLGSHVSVLVPEDRSDETAGIIARLARGERVERLRTVRRRRDGTLVHVALTVAPVTEPLMGIVGASIVARDLTDRQRVETLQAHLASIVESSDDAIFSMSLDGRIRTWNSAAEKLFGFSTAEVDGRSVLSLFPPPRAGDIRSMLRRVADARRAQHLETPALRKEDVIVPVSVTISPVHDARGRVVAASAIARDMTERKVVEQELSRQALHDPLTGLPNRALFQDRLEQALLHVERRPHPVSVLFLDLDAFKAVNDEHGHAVGDRLLVAVAERLRSRLRDEDTAARLGGDEFGLLLDGTGADGAAVVAERVLARLREPVVVDGNDLGGVEASIGGTCCDESGARADDLLGCADAAMYVAKRAGGNRYQPFRPEMREALAERLQAKGALRGAVDDHRLRLHFQPIISLADGQVVAVEALLRWEHPSRGLLAAYDFLAVAEEGGLMPDLGRWVLEEACAAAARWQGAPGGGPAVAVNLSPRQLDRRDLVDQVATALEISGLAPDRLVLELAESATVHGPVSREDVVHEVHRLGVRLALDNFGAGYSSLEQLRRLPFDVLKMDRSFLHGHAVAHADVFPQAVVDLAHALGLGVVAEGIERSDQLDAVRRMGCDLGQGYALCRPVEGGVLAPRLADAARFGGWPLPA